MTYPGRRPYTATKFLPLLRRHVPRERRNERPNPGAGIPRSTWSVQGLLTFLTEIISLYLARGALCMASAFSRGDRVRMT
jgi:hypothetical protein